MVQLTAIISVLCSYEELKTSQFLISSVFHISKDKENYFLHCFGISNLCLFCVRTLPFDELIQRIQVDEQSSFFICKVVV